MNGLKFCVLYFLLFFSLCYSCSSVCSPKRKVLFELLFIHPQDVLHSYLQMKNTTVLLQILTFFVRKSSALSTSFTEENRAKYSLHSKKDPGPERPRKFGSSSSETKLRRFRAPGAWSDSPAIKSNDNSRIRGGGGGNGGIFAFWLDYIN